MTQPEPDRGPSTGKKPAEQAWGGNALHWIAILLVVAFVALLTGQRENSWGADAWEHHRAIVALTRDLFQPDNPTFATTDPSIRYSPYSIALALATRWSGMDAYSVLSLAAVANTFLLLTGLLVLARSFGEERAMIPILIVVLTLYGQIPRYAGSLALADLPWHQVNPSAAAMGLLMWSLWLLKRIGETRAALPWACLLVLSTAFTLLSHGMTAVLYGIAFVAMALSLPRPAARRAALCVVGSCGVAVILALQWPWYDLGFALREKPDNEYWFNPTILRAMLFCWCVPSALGALPALSLRNRPMIRFGLLAGAGCYACSLVALVAHSPTLARLALPGVIFFQVAIGVYLHDVGVLRPGTWWSRMRRLLAESREVAAAASMETLLAIALLYFGLPQIWSILRDPVLAREWVAAVVGAEDKQIDIKQRLDALLEPVGETDVVLADIVTSWPVPSSSGRIVAALHREFFVQDQDRREEDVTAFFSAEEGVDRTAIINEYDVKWIVLCEPNIGTQSYDRLLEPSAVVGGDGLFVLMDAASWARARSEDR